MEGRPSAERSCPGDKGKGKAAVCQHADEILLVRVPAGQTERGAVSDNNEIWTGRCKGREVEAEVCMKAIGPRRRQDGSIMRAGVHSV